MTTSPSEQLAANVRAELARRKVRPHELADRVGLSTRAIQRRLAGEVAINVDELVAIASSLEVDVADLLGEAIPQGVSA